MAKEDALEVILRYHQQTKHRFEAYARGPDTLDWEDQPSPFRDYGESPALKLPLTDLEVGSKGPLYEDLFQPPCDASSRASLSLTSLARLLELSFGLSAWKSLGPDRWALRCNPSSGNLHPTEVYIVISGYDELLVSGIYHYDPLQHQLVRRCKFGALRWCGVLVGCASLPWREAWKYGERAFRYCQHDIGHALGALRFAAAEQNFSLTLQSDWSDSDLEALLGLSRKQDYEADEKEFAGFLVAIDQWCDEVPKALWWLDQIKEAQWSGKAKRLSRKHFFDWPIIDQVWDVSKKVATVEAVTSTSRMSVKALATPLLPAQYGREPASHLIKQRRSAQRFDGETVMPKQAFFRILQSCNVSSSHAPFDCWPWAPAVHLLIFVHRVEGIAPGLYFLPRGENAEGFKSLVNRQFDWAEVDGSPGLLHMISANAQKTANKLCCYQGIAGNGAFSLGMFAEFDSLIQQEPWHYRRLFWECGLIGQVLYLEAEAAGFRGTGIGCFFDDHVHELIGLTGTQYQDLYHFTVGMPKQDNRLESYPAYEYLDPR